jgi:hypothetical protein
MTTEVMWGEHTWPCPIALGWPYPPRWARCVCGKRDGEPNWYRLAEEKE